MRNFRIILSVLVILLVSTTVFAGETLDRINKSGMIFVATSPNYPPQSFLNDDNEMDGFDVDVAKEVGKRLGAEVKFVTPGWTIMTSGRWMGRWDLSVGSMTPTKARSKVLSFPAIYKYGVARFAVHKDSTVKNMKELNGKTIGAATGETTDMYLRKTLKIDALGAPPIVFAVTPGKLKNYELSSMAMDDLRLGDGKRLDAILTETYTIKKAIENGYPLKMVEGVAFAEPLALATDKVDPAFDTKLTVIVDAMKKDGTLKKLSLKWYGVDLISPN